MLIDTHAHLADVEFYEDGADEARSVLNDDIWVINSGVDYNTSKKSVELAENFEEGVYATIGIQPEALLYDKPEEFDHNSFKTLSKSSKVVAVGEIGLDYHYLEKFKDEEFEKQKEKQKKLFLSNLKFAKEIQKPIVIHSRDAYDDLIDTLNDFRGESELEGSVHCFSGNFSQARELLEMGLHLGFTGVITFSNKMDEIIEEVPMDKILVETDSPFLTPVPNRGKKNNPKNVKYVAEHIAKIKNLNFEEVAEKTTENARGLFGI